MAAEQFLLSLQGENAETMKAILNKTKINLYRRRCKVKQV